MKGLLSGVAYWATTILGSYLLLGKHLPRPQVASLPRGFNEGFHTCNRCAAITRHLVHSTTCRTCQTCGNRTTPGDTP